MQLTKLQYKDATLFMIYHSGKCLITLTAVLSQCLFRVHFNCHEVYFIFLTPLEYLVTVKCHNTCSLTSMFEMCFEYNVKLLCLTVLNVD